MLCAREPKETRAANGNRATETNLSSSHLETPCSSFLIYHTGQAGGSGKAGGSARSPISWDSLCLWKGTVSKTWKTASLGRRLLNKNGGPREDVPCCAAGPSWPQGYRHPQAIRGLWAYNLQGILHKEVSQRINNDNWNQCYGEKKKGCCGGDVSRGS